MFRRNSVTSLVNFFSFNTPDLVFVFSLCHGRCEVSTSMFTGPACEKRVTVERNKSYSGAVTRPPRVVLDGTPLGEECLLNMKHYMLERANVFSVYRPVLYI